MRLIGVTLGVVSALPFTLAHRARWACAIRRRASADTMRFPPVLPCRVVPVLPSNEDKAAMALSSLSRS